jgi:bifunctional DNA-binding transcriptional regulator/antitoxin component of YhaV-PrlF toxin-antitoxin module
VQPFHHKAELTGIADNGMIYGDGMFGNPLFALSGVSAVMAIFPVQFSAESVVVLPVELARRVGLEEGTSVQITVTPEGLTLTPATDYVQTWRLLESQLRYQAASLGLPLSDERDDAYWKIVEPMLQDLERDVPA